MSEQAAPSPSIDDNPCWGGPEPNRHDLEYLLRVLGSTTTKTDVVYGHDVPPPKPAFPSSEERSSWIRRIRRRLILYEDENYLAIHKPADLRMDGPHGATIHKLLLYLFPPPSLLRMASGGGGTTRDDDEDEEERHRLLLESIAPLSKHSFLRDDPHRMAHQLDYATSGVLLVGKSKRATGAACRSFEERRTDKRYVAVVIDPAPSASRDPPLGPDFFDRLPILPPSALESWTDGSLEKRYRRKRRRDMDEREGKRGTFDGYMPVHSVFDKWRAALLREKKGKGKATQQNTADEKSSAEDKKVNRKRRQNNLPPLPSPKVALTSREIDELLSLPSSWKSVKSHCADSNNNKWTTIAETMAEEYNKLLAEHYAKKRVGREASYGSGRKEDDERKPAGGANLPPLFRIQNDDKNDAKGNGSGDGGGRDTNTFYICASIGEPRDGRFFVVVDPSAAREGCVNDAPVSSSLPELRPSLTECTVLWRGHVDPDADDAPAAAEGRGAARVVPAAKVTLRPRTGRRHQLRVHMAHVAGCPILGDATYGGVVADAEEGGGPSSDGRARGGAARRRMCLHARELTIPLMGGVTRTFMAPDPFPTMRMGGRGVESR